MNENVKTGLSSIDKPWMKQYPHLKDTNFNYIKGKTLWDVIQESFQKFSDVPYIEYFGNTISRETFESYVEMWARSFRALGVKTGDYIPVYAPSTPESLAVVCAGISIGAKTYFQKLTITPKALDEETSEAKIAVVFDKLWPNVRSVFEKDRFKHVIVTSAADSMMFPLKQILHIQDYIENRKKQNRIPNTSKYISVDKLKKIASYYTGDYKVPYEQGRIAAITTSSGTTSNVVKGIMDSNEGALAALTCALNADSAYTKGKRTLAVLPTTASTSLNCLQLLPTLTGGTIIFDPRVDMNLWYNQLLKYKPDITITTGSLWERFGQDILMNEKRKKITHDLSWMDCMIMGGSGVYPEILNNLNTIIRERGAKNDICVGYGFSEVFGVLSVTKYNGSYKESLNKKDVIGVGVPLPGYTIGIFDENGNELPYGSGARGELWIKAPSAMEGYYNKPIATSEVLVGDWLHSGDLCEIGEDGTIYFYGRIKNSIIINNEKHYLFDIATSVKKRFDLYDIIVEKKMLKDKSNSLVIYLVQKDENRIDLKELINSINEYLNRSNIYIDGYKESFSALPIEPTTLKARTRDLDGFINYSNNIKSEVSYSLTDEDDVYTINKDEIKELVKTKKNL